MTEISAALRPSPELRYLREPPDPVNGVLFIASGARYARFALAAATSIRRSNPRLSIALFTDQHELSVRGEVDIIGLFRDGHYRSKVDYIGASPFERSLYLDTDIRVVAPLHDMFRLLERFDLAIAHAHARNKLETLEKWRSDIPRAFPQLNAGVILYRRGEALDRLWRDWAMSFHDAGFAKDQVTLRELLWLADDLRWTVLPPEYNIRYDKYLRVWRPSEARPHILHFRAFHEEAPGGDSRPGPSPLKP